MLAHPHATSVHHLRVIAQQVRRIANENKILPPSVAAELLRDANRYEQIARSQIERERILRGAE